MWLRSAVLCLLLATAGWSANSGHSVGLTWARDVGAETCIAQAELAEKLRARLGGDPFSGSPGQWIEGIVQRQGRGWVARLFERDAAGTTLGERVFESSSADCRELDEAIVLAVLLLLDPSAGGAAATPDEGPPPQALSGARPRPAAAQKQPAAGDTSRGSLSSPSLEPMPAGPSEQQPQPTPVWVAGNGVLARNLLPGWTWGLGAELTVLYEWPVRSAFAHFPERVATTSDGSVGLSLSTFDLGLCAPFPSEARWRHSGCLSLATGVIGSAAYADIPRPPLERLWGAFRADWGVSLRLAGPVAFDARAVGWLPLVLWEYRVAGQPRVFRQPWFVGGAQLGISLRL